MRSIVAGILGPKRAEAGQGAPESERLLHVSLERHRARVSHLHLKDSAGAPEHRQVDLGVGVIDWPRVLRTATAGRVRHVFVEHDEPADAWATVQAGRTYLRRLGY